MNFEFEFSSISNIEQYVDRSIDIPWRSTIEERYRKWQGQNLQGRGLITVQRIAHIEKWTKC